ncbi:MAG: DUF2905 family protein [Microgenomates group bacterium]|nr:DUF2905 family protein [Microgenomates group bacterium]
MFFMGDYLISFGILITFFGLLLKLFQKINFFLPGDILIKKEHFTFYFPLTTSIILSLILTIILNLIKK